MKSVSCLLLLSLHLASVTYSQETSRDSWSGWNSWSECSRSCGGGVSFQVRSCLSRNGGVGKSCLGQKRRNRMCNTQDCPEESEDFRASQCAAYDSKPYNGKHFKWVPWQQGPFKCELRCMPKGESFYVRFAKKVTDGTRCQDNSLDVCVDGKCEHVGCDLALNSQAKFDKCRECNGKNDRCKPVKGYFSLEGFEYDYIKMLTIPARSTSITIKEVGDVRNYIALKNYKGDYALNGNRLITLPGLYKVNGNFATYKRSSSEHSVTIDGPISAPVTVEVLAYYEPLNISYEYYVPNGMANKITTYSWLVQSVGDCSLSCAGGVRNKKIQCIASDDKQAVSDFLCKKNGRPADQEVCNLQPCPARWLIGEWSPCSTSCGAGSKIRRVQCIRYVENAQIERLPSSECKDKQPQNVESCVVQQVCPLWHSNQWSECSKSCGPGLRTRAVRCVGTSDYESNTLEEKMCDETVKPIIQEPCDFGSCNLTWTLGPWSECSAHCGKGMRNRQVTCQNSKAKVFPDGYCDKTFQPQSEEDCVVSGPCLPIWYATQWSKCSRQCGDGIQMRMVYCASKEGANLRIIGSSNCKTNLKPTKTRSCHQLKPCISQFFTSTWRSCSASCGGGLRFRRVRCYADSRIDYSEVTCKHLKKPGAVEICNLQSCDAKVQPTKRAAVTTAKKIIKTTQVIVTTTQPTTKKITTQPTTKKITTKRPVTRKPTTVKSQPIRMPITALVINFQGPGLVDEGEPADFYCNAIGKPAPEIAWSLNGNPVEKYGDRFLLLNGNTHLLITKVHPSDTGSVTCNAKNEGGQDSKSIKLQVSSLPKVVLSPSVARLKEGNVFFMKCDVKAYPEAKVTWKKSGRPYYGDSISGRVLVTEKLIQFKKLLIADSGAYECHAENSAGFDRKTMRLQVDRDEKDEVCVDDPERANCEIIKQFSLCKHNFYSQVCCKTCSGS